MVQGELRKDVIDRFLADAHLDFEQLDIQDFWKQIGLLEKKLGVRYVRMDFGIPGLPPPAAALRAQADALSEGKAVCEYPPSEGVVELKEEVAKFLLLVFGLQLDPNCCLPTCGATQAAFLAQAIAGRRYKDRNRILHLEPGYPPIKAQTRLLGLESCGIDLFSCREKRLIDAIQLNARDGRLAAISWSNPNNPTSITLSADELRGIAAVCEKNDVIAIEDAAYLGMVTGEPATSVTAMNCIANYTDNFFLLLSASKMFSYAGERIGVLASSSSLMGRSYDALEELFSCKRVDLAVKRTLFNLTAGAPHTAQYAVAGILKAINDGKYDLVQNLSEYGRRAKAVKSILLRNGFHTIYKSSCDESEHGFYLTFGFPGLTAAQLLKELLYHGITALPLSAFGSCSKDGLRACVGLLEPRFFPLLERGIQEFSRSRMMIGA
jgi:aspartate/methionine/tyrosine aminotransferase